MFLYLRLPGMALISALTCVGPAGRISGD